MKRARLAGVGGSPYDPATCEYNVNLLKELDTYDMIDLSKLKRCNMVKVGIYIYSPIEKESCFFIQARILC